MVVYRVLPGVPPRGNGVFFLKFFDNIRDRERAVPSRSHNPNAIRRIKNQLKKERAANSVMTNIMHNFLTFTGDGYHPQSISLVFTR
jgi:hypothetical protein